MAPPLILAAATVALALSPIAATTEADTIAAFLKQSAQSWNRGDLDTFMRGYENSPSTVYISSKGIIHGYAAIRARYASHYKRGMGSLSFSDLTVRPLGPGYAVALAHWHLALHGGKKLTGPFSLVLHDSPSGWHIVEDCTP